MRVLHVIPAVGPSYGGPSAAIVGMTESLAARGIEVEVATTDRDGPARLDVPLGTVRRGGVPYHFFPTSASGEWKLSLPLARWLRANVPGYQLVHVHGLFSFSTIPACRAAHAHGVPYVLRPLGMLSTASFHFRSWKKKPYYALVERRHLERAAAIHVTSDQERDGIRALGFEDRARLVPLGVDAPEAAPRRMAVRGPRSRVRVLFVGRLHPIKQLPLLLDAFARAAHRLDGAIELVIAGGGESAYRRELEGAAARLGLMRLVRFVGEVDQAEKQTLLDEADIFVLPSRTENFGLAAAEALAAGIPVIVTEQVGLAADVAQSSGGRVVTPDADRLAEAIAELAVDEALRARMGACARRLAEERFSWAHSAEGLITLYEEVLAAQPAPWHPAEVW